MTAITGIRYFNEFGTWLGEGNPCYECKKTMKGYYRVLCATESAERYCSAACLAARVSQDQIREYLSDEEYAEYLKSNINSYLKGTLMLMSYVIVEEVEDDGIASKVIAQEKHIGARSKDEALVQIALANAELLTKNSKAQIRFTN